MQKSHLKEQPSVNWINRELASLGGLNTG